MVEVAVLPAWSAMKDLREIVVAAFGVTKIASYEPLAFGITTAFCQVLPPSPDTWTSALVTGDAFAPGCSTTSKGSLLTGFRATELFQSTAGLNRVARSGSTSVAPPV